MCLGIPMEIIEIEGDKGWVKAGGVRIRAALDLVSDVKVGDYVIIHAGFAINKVNEAAARDTLELLSQIFPE
jgi:hydrogenase expression/formation protein HypC